MLSKFIYSFFIVIPLIMLGVFNSQILFAQQKQEEPVFEPKADPNIEVEVNDVEPTVDAVAPTTDPKDPKAKVSAKDKGKKDVVAPVPPKEKTFRVDFREKEINDFLKAMSAIIGKNIVADEQIRGKITVISPQPIPVEKAFSYLTAVLAVKGFGVVVEEKLLRVITIKDAIAKGKLIHIGKKALDPEWLKENVVVTAITDLEFADPSRLSGILKRVTNNDTDIVDYKEGETLIITGGALEVDRLLRMLITLDQPIDDPTKKEKEPLPIGGDIHIIRLANMEADKVEQTLRKVTMPPDPNLKKNPNQNQNQNQNLNLKKIEVVSHPESNSLIFVGSSSEWEIVKALIQQVDISREQVLLEVLITEVAEDKTNEFGIEWRFQKDGVGQFNTGVLAGALAGASAAGSSLTASASNALNTLTGLTAGVIIEGKQTILGLVNANINNQDFLVLSAPKIVTLNNQEAEINVGQDVPVQTSRSVSTVGAGSPIVNQFDYRPTGVRLKFTPQVNSQNEITLKLSQEIKDVLSTDQFTGNPRFTTREVKTSIKIKNRQTIVIGGLISTNKTVSERKIPVLGDIPLLGYLFKRSSTIVKRTNLLVFITPHIVTNTEVADKLTDELLKEQKIK